MPRSTFDPSSVSSRAALVMEYFAPKHLDSLERFSQIAWGNSQALLRQLPGAAPDVQFLDLGEYFKSFQALFSGLLHCPGKILVRDEYRAAVEALETDPAYKTGAYISGEPGIGKTFFLCYALVHFLGQRQPVALQQLGGSSFYVLFKQTATIHHLDDTEPLSKCGFVWALSDSNADIQCPPASFTAKPGRIRIIQTTPPEASRWRQWSKQWDTLGYIMDVWTDKEIANLAVVLELDVERVLTLADRWGPIPRLVTQLKTEDAHTEIVYRDCAAMAVWKCENIIHAGRSLDLSISSPFYFIRPMKLDTGDICRLIPDMVLIPTHKLLSVLAESLQEQDGATMRRFYRVLTRSAETRPAADFIVETWFRRVIATGNRRVSCQWISQGPDDNIAQLPILLPVANVRAPSTRKALSTQKPPYCWHALRADFPGIHSVFVLEKEIFAFQINLGAEYMSPVEGLQEMEECLPADVKNFSWRVVFVGAEGARIAQVARRWARTLRLSGKESVRVGWFALDEAENINIPDRVYDDEVESVLEEWGEATMETEGQ